MKLIIFRVVLDFFKSTPGVIAEKARINRFFVAACWCWEGFFFHFLTSPFEPRGEREKPFERRIYHPQKKLLSSFIFFSLCSKHELLLLSRAKNAALKRKIIIVECVRKCALELERISSEHKGMSGSLSLRAPLNLLCKSLNLSS